MSNLTNPLTVSVVMITYNHEQYIREAIEGVLMQECDFEIELILADDKSPDYTENIVKDIIKNHPKGHWIKYTRHTTNKGMIPNFIWALDQAKGKYIALCEGDDYWTDPLKLQKQVDFLEGNEEYGLVHTNYQITNTNNGATKNNNGNFIDGQPFDEYLMGQFHIATLTTCFRKDLFNKIDKSYLKQNFKMSDHPMWIEMIRLSKIKYFKDVTANYNIQEESASRSRNPLKQIAFFKNIWEVRIYFAEKYKRNNLIVKIQRNLHYYDSILFLLEKKYAKSLLYLIKSLPIKKHDIMRYLNFISVR